MRAPQAPSQAVCMRRTARRSSRQDDRMAEVSPIAFRQSRRVVEAGLIVAAGAGLYLFGMDMLYDLEHRIYASNSGGVIELLIDILIAGASVGVLWRSWRYRQLLLNPACGQV